MAGSAFTWLHLSDLHCGQSEQDWLWPNVRDAFLGDLGRVVEQAGPIQAVLFTGDLVNRGTREEFDRLNEKVLGPLWKRLGELDSGDAVLLAVPGNHDLVRPAKLGPAERCLVKPEWFADVAEEFWGGPSNDYRAVVDRAFDNFLTWRLACPYAQSAELRGGLLPGDFSASFDLPDGRRVGVLGLNSAFLQLAGGDYEGKLCLHQRQLHEACLGDGPAWAAEHDVCLLMTHHPPVWLGESCRKDVYPEINPAGRFAAHLFGHMHEAVIRGSGEVGGPMLRQWQANSLFSHELWGEPPRFERHHGFAVGQITFSKVSGALRYWPRQASKSDPNGWDFDADTNQCRLNKDGGTRAMRVELRSRSTSVPKPAAAARRTDRVERLLHAYRQRALELVDIVDLANLPEDDRHIAMQRLLLRQLYIPLRMTLDAPTDEGLDDKTLAQWEERRERARLAAAGRVTGEARRQDAQALGALLSDPSGFGTDVPRLAILGDPGGGKTTLLRWLSTAWLLRVEHPDMVAELPDIDSLPAEPYLPILVRCRSLDREQSGQCALEDILCQTLRQMELKLPQGDMTALVEALRTLLADGRVALLIDGLDEITDPILRAQFCERIETFATAYPQAPIVATSRIVGYREMPRRLGHGFRHATLADLAPKAKDEFVRRWCEVVERDPDRRRDEAAKLIRGIHDESGRVERLTGNPTLLTTMALVQRKVGDLPQRRHRLYEQAVSVLLNWRSEVDKPLPEDEAWPQLEYLAWAMCDRGRQRLRRDEVIALLEDVRRDYPNLRAVHERTPEAFLAELEARTSLLVEVGAVQHDGLTTPVYEFRHLTFQEYLAAMAIIRGHYPGHNPALSVAQRIAPLAGQVVKVEGRFRSEWQVTENWREALRLCVAACNDDDVDRALQEILDGGGGAESGQALPRAVMAALCLADEPNVSEGLAEELFARMAVFADEYDGDLATGLNQAAMAVASSVWAGRLESALVAAFMSRDWQARWPAQALAGSVAWRRLSFARITAGEAEHAGGNQGHDWAQMLVDRLADPDDRIAVTAALAVAEARHGGADALVPGLADALLTLAERGPVQADAACWALYCLTARMVLADQPRWTPTEAQYQRLASLLPAEPDALNGDSGAWLWLAFLAQNVPSTVLAPGLRLLLQHDDGDLRKAALGALVRLRGDGMAAMLLSWDLVGEYGWLDPQAPIATAHVGWAANRLGIPVANIRRRYEAMARDYGLQLDWKPKRA